MTQAFVSSGETVGSRRRRAPGRRQALDRGRCRRRVARLRAARGGARSRVREDLRAGARAHRRDHRQARRHPGIPHRSRRETLRRQAREVGCAIAGQSPALVPADGAIYALRDDDRNRRLDPTHRGERHGQEARRRFRPDPARREGGFGRVHGLGRRGARARRECLEIAARIRPARTRAAITDMSQPLGTAIGNALEVREAVAVLRGERPGRLASSASSLPATALSVLTAASSEDAQRVPSGRFRTAPRSRRFGRWFSRREATERWWTIPAVVLPAAPMQMPIVADRSGTIAEADAAEIGAVAHGLGAGRHAQRRADRPCGGYRPGAEGGRCRRGRGASRDGARPHRGCGGRGRCRGAGGRSPSSPSAVAPPPLVHAWIEEVG